MDELIETILTASPEALAIIGRIIPRPSFERYFEVYDRLHPEAPLGPEPTKEQLITAAEVCRHEGRLLAEPLAEAARMVQS